MQHECPVCGRGLAWQLWQCPLPPAPAGSAALLNIRSAASRGNTHRLQHLEAAQRSTTPTGYATPVQLRNNNTLKLGTQGSPACLHRDTPLLQHEHHGCSRCLWSGVTRSWPMKTRPGSCTGPSRLCCRDAMQSLSPPGQQSTLRLYAPAQGPPAPLQRGRRRATQPPPAPP